MNITGCFSHKTYKLRISLWAKRCLKNTEVLLSFFKMNVIIVLHFTLVHVKKTKNSSALLYYHSVPRLPLPHPYTANSHQLLPVIELHLTELKVGLEVVTVETELLQSVFNVLLSWLYGHMYTRSSHSLVTLFFLTRFVVFHSTRQIN